MNNDKKDRTQLKSYFKSNAAPTEQNFRDFIDSVLNQKEDGIAKMPDGPIAVQSSGQSEELLHFYRNFNDTNPVWRVSQRVADKNGFSVSDGTGSSRFFINAANGNVGLGGITEPVGRLHVFELQGSAPTANSGTIVLEHGNAGGKSSVVFRSKINAGSDFGYICYQDNESGTGEGSILSIGSQNDLDDHIALLPGGNVGIGTTKPDGKLHIVEARGTKPTATSGSILLEHSDTGGQSSIVFKSKNNAGNDFGYISFQDDATVGGTGEANILMIGTSNEPNDHIALMPSGNTGVGTKVPVSKLHVSATGGSNPVGNGILVYNENPSTGQDAIISARTNTASGGNPFLSLDVNGAGGWSMGTDNTDAQSLKFSADPSNLRTTTKLTLRKDGNLGLGTATPAGKLHLFETTGSKPTVSSGTIVLEHGNAGGQSSIVFKSKNNAAGDFGYISFQDDAVIGGTGDASILMIGTQNSTNDHISLMPGGNVGIGIANPSAKLHVKANGGGNPAANGIYVFNESTTDNQDAIITARVNGASAGNPMFSMDVAGITGWSVGIDNKDGQSLKFANNWSSVDSETKMTLNKSGNLGIGTNLPAGRLHIFEPVGTKSSATNGSIVLEHGDTGGQSSIVFMSKNNGTSDFAYIAYQDDATLGGAGESSLLTIGTQNDSDDHIALLPSGNVGIGTQAPVAKLDVAGKIRIADGSQANKRILTSDANGVAVWAEPEVRRDFRPYGKASYLWDGTDKYDTDGGDPIVRLSSRGSGVFGKYDGFNKWGTKCMFSMSNLSQEAQSNDAPPANGVYLNLPATAGVHNALLLSTIDSDRWSVFSVWLCDVNGNNCVKLLRSSNNANGADTPSSYLLGPRNATKETAEHAWMTFPVTAQQVASYSNGGKLLFLVTSGPLNTNSNVLYLSGIALTPNPYGFVQHCALTLHWGMNSNAYNELAWNSIWNNEGLAMVPANSTNYAYVKVVDSEKDLLVTFHEHNNSWHGSTLLINVGSDPTVLSPSAAFLGIANVTYNSKFYMRPQSILIPAAIVKKQLIKSASGVSSILQLRLRNLGKNPYHIRGIDTEIFF